eukprot:CFRG0228T1
MSIQPYFLSGSITVVHKIPVIKTHAFKGIQIGPSIKRTLHSLRYSSVRMYRAVHVHNHKVINKINYHNGLTTKLLATAYDSASVEKDTYEWWETSGVFKPSTSLHKTIVGSDATDGTVQVKKKKHFSMILPPPNVTGSLHIGHALTGSVQDAIVRWQRMGGEGSSTDSSVVWIPGSDHAGIATQAVVEKQLAREGIYRRDMTRTSFVDKVFEWKYEYGNTIHRQHRRLGLSLDWSREYFTLDPHHSQIVADTFVSLFDSEMIYRDVRMCNWCVRLQTVISDIEVDNKAIDGRTMITVPKPHCVVQGPDEASERDVEVGVMHDFAYQLADENEFGRVNNSDVSSGVSELVVSTTRIETMLGDVAVAIHPEDKRYMHLHGRSVVHPFTGKRLPIVLDADLVDMSKGTGAVKLTPAHDFNDYECGLKHRLAVDGVMLNRNGEIVESLVALVGLQSSDRFDARKEIVEKLKTKGLYRGSKDHPMVLPVCSRSGDIIEPMLLPQWFVKSTPLQQYAREVIESGETRITPARYEKEWFRWVNEMNDWCISRQLWWGHRIPAYRVIDSEGQVLGWVAATSAEHAREKVTQGGMKPERGAQTSNTVIGKNIVDNFTLIQDEDVLDTWFSSAVVPMSATEWSGDEHVSYPTDVLETGSDILFFWVARMAMLCKHMTGKSPFRDIYLHPMVRDAQGRKMSKSLGNVIDPLDVINGQTLLNLINRIQTSNLSAHERDRAVDSLKREYPDGIPACGADALRFTLCEYMQQGANINMSVERVQQNSKFCNKIWQLVRFYDHRLKLQTSYVNHSLRSSQDIQKVLHLAQPSEKWILSRLACTVQTCNQSLSNYNLGAATEALVRFIWFDLCDVYLETYKLYQNDSFLKEVSDTERGNVAAVSPLNILGLCIENSLRLLHPFMPYITENLWQHITRDPAHKQSQPDTYMANTTSISMSSYPSLGETEGFLSASAEADMTMVLAVVSAVRDMRQSFQLSPKVQLPVQLSCTARAARSIETNSEFISRFCNVALESVVLTGGQDENNKQRLIRFSVNDDCWLEISPRHLPQNVEKLQSKLKGQLTVLNKKIAKLEQTLNNPGASTKMPANVFRAKVEELEHLREKRTETESTRNSLFGET